MNQNKGKQNHRGGSAPQRRQPLQDNYYYEEPPRGRSGNRNAGGNQEFQNISSHSSGWPQEKGRRQKRKKGHKGLAALFVFLLLIGAGIWYVFGYLLNGLTFHSIDKGLLGIDTSQSNGSIKNIALFGLDAREDVDEGRSDALMILSVDNEHHKLKLTSILRDSKVSIEGYGEDKITHAYAYGGPELSIKTLNQNFKLDIEDYVTVNFYQMASIVDAFGGTRVNITYEEAEEINTNLSMLAAESSENTISDSDYIYEDGEVLLNGNQAVAYARIRHLDSDDMRASRQQNVLKGLIDQLKTKSKLEYPELIRKVVPMCETSFDILDITGLTPIMLTDFSTETLSIPGEEENADGETLEDGSWVYAYDLEIATQHISRFIYEEGSPYYSSGEAYE